MEYQNIFIPISDKIYSKPISSQISLLFETWNLVLFPHSDAQPEILQGIICFVELGHFHRYFVKNSRKKGPAFLLDTVKTTF